jgi:hypothetical protein
MYVYIGAALLIMLYLGWWLSRHWGAGVVALVVLLTGAVLLTPAYPRAGVETFAPALIVAVFQYLTEGLDGAMHALRPLAFMSLAAVILALLLRLTIFRGRRQRKPPKAQKAAAKGPRGPAPAAHNKRSPA